MTTEPIAESVAEVEWLREERLRLLDERDGAVAAAEHFKAKLNDDAWYHKPRYCPTCGTDGPGRRRSVEDLSLCDDPWHETHPRRWPAQRDGTGCGE